MGRGADPEPEESGCDRPEREGEVCVGIEELDAIQRDPQLEHVARSDPVGRVDDGHDVAAGAGRVDQLLVAEVLDDLSLGVDAWPCRR